VLLVVAALLMPASAGAQAARGLAVGYVDSVFNADAAVRGPWLQRALNSGADVVRVNVGWVAPDTPERPPGFDARDPGAPQYDFTTADAAIVDATNRGLRVLVITSGAPRWAEGADRLASASPGSWQPDPRAFGEYATALARRYSGTFPDPARPGQVLPRVDAFQAWNEPNLEKYLTPLYKNGRTFAPAHYRRMMSAFYRGVKSVRPSVRVVSAGMAPHGDPFSFGKARRKGQRIRPARFVREMLCLRQIKKRLLGTGCSDPARFDVLAHHAYSIGAPRRPAPNLEDVSIADTGKLTRLLRAGERTGGALPRKRHRVWVTEVSYDSSPPDRNGVPLARHARYLQETFFLLWRQGVDTIFWYGIQDDPVSQTQGTAQSGTFFIRGAPKPAARAFRFPLVAERAGRGALNVWGRAPVAGLVRIQRRTPRGWRPVATKRARRHGVFSLRIRARGRVDLRARVGSETSLTWRAT